MTRTAAKQETATLDALMALELSAADKRAWLSEPYTSSTLMRHPVTARLSLVRDGSNNTTHLMLIVPGQVIVPAAMTMDAATVAVFAGMDDASSVAFTRDHDKEEQLSGIVQRSGLAVATGTLPFPSNGGKLH